MEKYRLAIATISWARDEKEEVLLYESLEWLSQLALPIFITDGGSSDSFVAGLQRLRHVSLFKEKGLWSQARRSSQEAYRSGADLILYTEPDKLLFFKNHLQAFINHSTLYEQAGVLLASRSPKGLASFPPFQQMTETTINRCCQEITGLDTDYCYGPFLFQARLLPQLETLPGTIGWGWRPYLFTTAHRLGYTVTSLEGDFMCPPDQQTENAAERIYRMKQLTQNIDGIVLAAANHPVGR